jgi:hypothetical protein
MIFDLENGLVLFRVTASPRKLVEFLGGLIFGARSSTFHGRTQTGFDIPTGLAT